MKLRVVVEKYRLYEVEVDVNSLDDAKSAIEGLIDDDLREFDSGISTEIFNEMGESVEGAIQPSYNWIAL